MRYGNASEVCLLVETAPIEKRNKSRIFLDNAIFMRDKMMTGTARRIKSKMIWIALNAGTIGFVRSHRGGLLILPMLSISKFLGCGTQVNMLMNMVMTI